MSLLTSAAIQCRVIVALILREMLTRYGRRNIGFFWLFVEPMLFTGMVTAFWVVTKSAHGSVLPIVGFAVTGFSSILLWRNAANRSLAAIESNLGLLYHRNVRVIDLFASRIILEIAGATISIIVLSAGFIALGVMDSPEDIFIMFMAWGLLAWFAIGLGLTVGVCAYISEAFSRIWRSVSYLLFALSGALFMVDWLPPGAREIVLWIPMVHGVEMLRSGYYGDAVTTYEAPGYLIMVNHFLLFTGLILLRVCNRRVVV